MSDHDPVTFTDILLGVVGFAFTLWAGVVAFFGQRLITNDEDVRERLVKLETVVEGALEKHDEKFEDHEARLRKLEES